MEKNLKTKKKLLKRVEPAEILGWKHLNYRKLSSKYCFRVHDYSETGSFKSWTAAEHTSYFVFSPWTDLKWFMPWKLEN